MELSLHVNDKLKLYTRTFLANYQHQVVDLLYQPIMGIEATSLYFTLWDFVNIEKGDLIISHRQLMTFFNWSLKKLAQIRGKLEAIGLLNIYYHQDEGYYLYELKQPLNAKQFFQDSNLNIYLLYQVGDNMYDYLEKKFITRPIEKRFVNITKSFEEMYQILDDVKKMDDEDTQYVTMTVNHFSIPLNYNFDFELFTLFVSRNFVDIDKMQREVKEAIVKEAALYQFDAQMMSKIVLDCIKDNEIDLDVLHQSARDYYKRLKTKTTYEEMKPAMTESEFSATMNKKRLTQKEKALKEYKTKTPQEWLSRLQNNTEVPSAMLEVVKVLYDDYKLPSEVMNVLIEFVRKRNDGRLPLEYTKAIASSWVFNQVKRAEDAIELVEKIQSKENEYAKRGEIAPTYYNHKKAKRVETEPVWMKDHQEYSDSKRVEQTEESVDMSELQKLLGSFK